ncbi:DUF4124 domain-containing protein [Pseudomonas aeruginosa]|uniref:DUF4124 domain-containing protein n=1 Tax=Pseudomonas aeruginosa TaxID=287 RepID=A0A6B1YK33_PSEAI|nr:DUF4124 domain-containing protein [Pseudomonas aeruginosa]MZZ15697.1 DUF4124 domain-containing protein [Pseudomonas aeruginosa]HEJ4235945.1 DUF4124 domain-containing protein [Pseudomonas aeruginosa]HEJ5366124.1 DUF4124 domain-containing protein [Pseudomonas aeruginosa]
MKRIFPVLALLFAVSSAQGATVFKCVGPDGKVTFTQQNCPENNNFHGSIDVKNHAPSGSSDPVKMAKPIEGPSIRVNQVREKEITVVGTPKPMDERFPESTTARETPIRRQNAGHQQKIEIRDVRVNTTKRNRDGSVSGTSTSYRVPVVK